jgi:hypothetical protein
MPVAPRCRFTPSPSGGPPVKASLCNPETGEVVDVKVGFDLRLSLTSWFLGVPLFLRKLNVWGAIMFAL